MAKKNTNTAARTIDQQEIKQWAEERGGRPALVTSTRVGTTGMLSIDFGDKNSDERLEKLEWEDFFRVFDENDLAFIYEEETPTGEISYSFAFVARGPEDEMVDMESSELTDTDLL